MEELPKDIEVNGEQGEGQLDVGLEVQNEDAQLSAVIAEAVGKVEEESGPDAGKKAGRILTAFFALFAGVMATGCTANEAPDAIRHRSDITRDRLLHRAGSQRTRPYKESNVLRVNPATGDARIDTYKSGPVKNPNDPARQGQRLKDAFNGKKK